MMKAALALALVGCSDPPVVLQPTDPQALEPTLDSLAAFGEKGAGSMGGQMAATYIQGKFMALGLSNIHTETFQFPRWVLSDSSFTLSIDGVMSSPGFDVFEASGSGTVDADVINVGDAMPQDLAGKDLTGKVALVYRSSSYHRSTQMKNVRDAGAVAMLYLSAAQDNLRQVGSVRYDWESDDVIPAITIGADDGKMITDALTASKPVSVHIGVTETSTPGTGTNIVAVIPGEVSDQIVLGAHYDTWFTGSADNSAGVAELLEVAHRRIQRGKPHYTEVFVAYDGEEIGLYGGYDYYRKHKIVAAEPILAEFNFECPAAFDPDVAAVAHSNQPKLDTALVDAGMRHVYYEYAGLEIVPQLFGGIIPTDIQGVYRGGTPAVTTAVDFPFYHTVKDTPETVDLTLLASSVDAFDSAVSNLDGVSVTDMAVQDPQLWTMDVTLATSGIGASVLVKDATGAPQANAIVKASYMVDDFTLVERAVAMTDANGRATVSVMSTDKTHPNNFLHVTAGPDYPLVEKITPVR
ncbi:MAG: M28 family peptidase [Kofleriaceae bacterium]